MALVLMVLAVPIARLRPRQGRFARVGIAVLAYFLYSNLLAAARVWIEKDAPGGQLGLWWVHLRAARDRGLAALAASCTPAAGWRRRGRWPGACVASRRAQPDGRARPLHRPHGARATPALVMLVLVALGALFLFIGQQDDIGVGSYTATQALHVRRR